MTFTLVGCEAGTLFVAVASRYPGVGGVVPYHRPGVGLVCAQHDAHSAMAEAILDALADGLPPADAVARGATPYAPERRQVVAMTPNGRHHHWCGAQVAPTIGLAQAGNLVAFGNMLATAAVCPAMLNGFLSRAGASLPDRLIAALQAAEAAGGDKRGREAAALRVWPAAYPNVAHLPIDLRIDSDDAPIPALARLLARRRAVDPDLP